MFQITGTLKYIPAATAGRKSHEMTPAKNVKCDDNKLSVEVKGLSYQRATTVYPESLLGVQLQQYHLQWLPRMFLRRSCQRKVFSTSIY